jgi:methylated-DNA-[protein]-cysteine S-methyltransferase
MLECTLLTAFGSLLLREEAGAITRLTWGSAHQEASSEVLEEAVSQLNAYCAGKRETFDLPLAVRGSDLQQAVCSEMRAIPFGEITTYGEIARRLGVPARAVGRACGANPIAIIIPCHRVMGAKGLTGFSGGAGVETKVALLRHEKAGGFLI